MSETEGLVFVPAEGVRTHTRLDLSRLHNGVSLLMSCKLVDGYCGKTIIDSNTTTPLSANSCSHFDGEDSLID